MTFGHLAMMRSRRTLDGQQCTPHRQRGYTYIFVLFSVALIGIGLAAASELWVKRSQDEDRIQDRWIFEQYKMALKQYCLASSAIGDPRVKPINIESLLEDKRFFPPLRHLRRIYTSKESAIKTLTSLYPKNTEDCQILGP